MSFALEFWSQLLPRVGKQFRDCQATLGVISRVFI